MRELRNSGTQKNKRNFILLFIQCRYTRHSLGSRPVADWRGVPRQSTAGPILSGLCSAPPRLVLCRSFLGVFQYFVVSAVLQSGLPVVSPTGGARLSLSAPPTAPVRALLGPHGRSFGRGGAEGPTEKIKQYYLPAGRTCESKP